MVLPVLRTFILGAADEKNPWRRRARNAALASVVSAAGLWTAAQVNPRVGPAVADGLRAVFGAGFVAWLEDTAYGAQDRYNGWRHGGDAPKTFWTAEPAKPLPPPSTGLTNDGGMSAVGDAGATPSNDAGAADFSPSDFTPPFPQVAGKGDGQWIPMADDVGTTPIMWKAQVHSDPKRPYTAVAIVAIDLTHARLHAVAGTDEPASETVKAKQRPGRVPTEDHAALVAVFNGGWQAVHGHFGMMVDGLELLPPRDKCCTVALYKDHSLRIAPWTELSGEVPSIQSYRQTPQCLRTNGAHNVILQDTSRNWGTAVDGNTVIRRSGIGVNKARNVLYYAVGDSLTGLSLAEALGAAGAADAAELDVNWAFPRFLTYEHKGALPSVSSSLIQASFKPTEYVGISWYRDFFYVTRLP
jgi:hypothetical protein